MANGTRPEFVDFPCAAGIPAELHRGASAAGGYLTGQTIMVDGGMGVFR